MYDLQSTCTSLEGRPLELAG